ncbi:MAG TPA: tryptophan 7-halogenase [Sandaracinaceae bacterium LLY-WYZ-13_1]|nr:tryptophan 7-halogenase [Sandaracinaceae bacterium LLY-WYZ-13_1]
MTEPSHDVAILGGGLAGNLLARQLRLEVPQARVLMVERSTEPRWKVGESTVEIAAHYLVAKQQLSTYLYDRHLPKNGLRFFFDTEGKDAPLTEMSEVGTDRPPPTPSFQLDRARFEADLREMNAADGVDVRLGWTARDLSLGEGGEAHALTLRGSDRQERVRARWLVDATGRARTVSRMRELKVEETDHRVGAIWGRFRGVQDLDRVPDERWRRRVRHVARTLSTNHFCYPGYWIWFIPLGNGVTSVGVVGLKEIFRRGMRTEAGFRAFLDEHRAVASLLEGAELLDLEGFTHLAYGTKRFFHPDRWALLGDAAAFPDPFYSPGSDFISLECDFVNDLVKRDLAGEPADEVADRLGTYDAFLKFRWEATMRLYRDLYEVFGSYELMRVKLNFDLGCYYNLWLDPVVRDLHLSTRFLQSELRRAPDTMRALDNFRDLFRGVAADLRARGAYFDGNLGRYNQGVDCLRAWMDEVGTERKKRLINRRTEEVFNYGRAEALKLLGDADVHPDERWHLFQFADATPLAPRVVP